MKRTVSIFCFWADLPTFKSWHGERWDQIGAFLFLFLPYLPPFISFSLSRFLSLSRGNEFLLTWFLHLLWKTKLKRLLAFFFDFRFLFENSHQTVAFYLLMSGASAYE